MFVGPLKTDILKANKTGIYIPLFVKIPVFIYAVLIFSLNIANEKIKAITPPPNFSFTKPTNERPKGNSPFLKTNFITKRMEKYVHCSSAVEIEGGKIRAFWYGGSREGAKDVAIFTAVFCPENSQWSPEVPILIPEKSQTDLKRFIKKVGNTSVIRDSKNRLWLFYVTVSFGGWSGASINYIISSDEGNTWSPSKRLITSPFLNLSTLVKGRPFLYNDGSIGLPVYHEFLGKFAELIKINSEGKVIYKKRLSWGRKTLSPEVLPIDDKTAFCFLRYTGKHNRFIYCLKTGDSGLTWSRPEKTTLPNHNSAFTCLKFKDSVLIKVLNHSNKKRDNLTLAVSKDLGKTWKKGFVFEKEYTMKHGPEHEFSYPWLIATKDGNFHLLYTWRSIDIKHIQFNEQWLKNIL